MDDPAAERRVAPVEVPPPETGRVLAGEFHQDAGYHVRRTRGTADWLLLHTVGGGGLVRTSETHVLATEPGEAVLLHPGALHDYGTDPAAGHWHLLYCHVHPPATWLALLDWPEVASGGPVSGIGRIRLGAEVAARVQQQLRGAARATRLAVGRPELFALNAIEAALLWYDTQNPRQRQLDERVLRVRRAPRCAPHRGSRCRAPRGRRPPLPVPPLAPVHRAGGNADLAVHRGAADGARRPSAGDDGRADLGGGPARGVP